MFDYHLQQMAYSLRGGPALAAPLLDGDENADVDYVIQIWGPDGVQLFRSSRGAMPPRAVLGFSDVMLNGSHYRVYSVQTPFQTIQIAQDMGARQARARALAVRAMLPMALIAPLLMLILWWVIRHSLTPLERTRQQVATREADDLSPLNDRSRAAARSCAPYVTCVPGNPHTVAFAPDAPALLLTYDVCDRPERATARPDRRDTAGSSP